MSIETANAGQVRDGDPELAAEAKIPDQGVNVLELATKALKKIARLHRGRSTSN